MDDKTPRHPKIAGLTDRAFRWWVHGLCYASEFLTDGVLPRAFCATVPGKVRAELCAAGLWTALTDGTGVAIHDYLDHQSSRAEVESSRSAARDRANSSREVRANFSRTSQEVRKPDTDIDTENRQQSVHPTRAHAPGPLVGSLPRDHMDCGFCSSRFCVKAKTVADLVRRYGEGGEAAVQTWLQSLHDGLGAHESAGGPLWVLQQFDAFLLASGRVSMPVSAKPAKPSWRDQVRVVKP